MSNSDQAALIIVCFIVGIGLAGALVRWFS